MSSDSVWPIILAAVLGFLFLLVASLGGLAWAVFDTARHREVYNDSSRRIALLLGAFWYVTLPIAKFMGWRRRRMKRLAQSMLRELLNDQEFIEQVVAVVDQQIRERLGLATPQGKVDDVPWQPSNWS